jgi:hypothetical protein
MNFSKMEKFQKWITNRDKVDSTSQSFQMEHIGCSHSTNMGCTMQVSTKKTRG